MRTLDQILTKKDYSRKTPASLFYKDSPLWQKLLTIGCVVFLAGAGLGEWKVLNSMLGGLPKAISLGVIGLAVLYALFYPDEKRLREIWKPALLYMSLMAALFFWSMVIWIESFAAVSSMIRSCSKLLFQSIAILTAVALVYLFREKAIELFTISICIANTAIMLLSIPGYGFAASIQSLVTCLITFGDADGYALQLEIHDLTFVFGQMILYYAVFAPRTTRQEKRKRWLYLLLCCWFCWCRHLRHRSCIPYGWHFWSWFFRFCRIGRRNGCCCLLRSRFFRSLRFFYGNIRKKPIINSGFLRLLSCLLL